MQNSGAGLEGTRLCVPFNAFHPFRPLRVCIYFRTSVIFLLRRSLVFNLQGIKATLKWFLIMSSGERGKVERV